MARTIKSFSLSVSGTFGEFTLISLYTVPNGKVAKIMGVGTNGNNAEFQYTPDPSSSEYASIETNEGVFGGSATSTSGSLLTGPALYLGEGAEFKAGSANSADISATVVVIEEDK